MGEVSLLQEYSESWLHVPHSEWSFTFATLGAIISWSFSLHFWVERYASSMHIRKSGIKRAPRFLHWLRYHFTDDRWGIISGDSKWLAKTIAIPLTLIAMYFVFSWMVVVPLIFIHDGVIHGGQAELDSVLQNYGIDFDTWHRYGDLFIIIIILFIVLSLSSIFSGIYHIIQQRKFRKFEKNNTAFNGTPIVESKHGRFFVKTPLPALCDMNNRHSAAEVRYISQSYPYRFMLIPIFCFIVVLLLLQFGLASGLPVVQRRLLAGTTLVFAISFIGSLCFFGSIKEQQDGIHLLPTSALDRGIERNLPGRLSRNRNTHRLDAVIVSSFMGYQDAPEIKPLISQYLDALFQWSYSDYNYRYSRKLSVIPSKSCKKHNFAFIRNEDAPNYEFVERISKILPKQKYDFDLKLETSPLSLRTEGWVYNKRIIRPGTEPPLTTEKIYPLMPIIAWDGKDLEGFELDENQEHYLFDSTRIEGLAIYAEAFVNFFIRPWSNLEQKRNEDVRFFNDHALKSRNIKSHLEKKLINCRNGISRPREIDTLIRIEEGMGFFLENLFDFGTFELSTEGVGINKKLAILELEYSFYVEVLDTIGPVIPHVIAPIDYLEGEGELIEIEVDECAICFVDLIEAKMIEVSNEIKLLQIKEYKDEDVSEIKLIDPDVYLGSYDDSPYLEYLEFRLEDMNSNYISALHALDEDDTQVLIAEANILSERFPDYEILSKNILTSRNKNYVVHRNATLVPCYEQVGAQRDEFQTAIEVFLSKDGTIITNNTKLVKFDFENADKFAFVHEEKEEEGDVKSRMKIRKKIFESGSLTTMDKFPDGPANPNYSVELLADEMLFKRDSEFIDNMWDEIVYVDGDSGQSPPVNLEQYILSEIYQNNDYEPNLILHLSEIRRHLIEYLNSFWDIETNQDDKHERFNEGNIEFDLQTWMAPQGISRPGWEDIARTGPVNHPHRGEIESIRKILGDAEGALKDLVWYKMKCKRVHGDLHEKNLVLVPSKDSLTGFAVRSVDHGNSVIWENGTPAFAEVSGLLKPDVRKFPDRSEPWSDPLHDLTHFLSSLLMSFPWEDGRYQFFNSKGVKKKQIKVRNDFRKSFSDYLESVAKSAPEEIIFPLVDWLDDLIFREHNELESERQHYLMRFFSLMIDKTLHWAGYKYNRTESNELEKKCLEYLGLLLGVYQTAIEWVTNDYENKFPMVDSSPNISSSDDVPRHNVKNIGKGLIKVATSKDTRLFGVVAQDSERIIEIVEKPEEGSAPITTLKKQHSFEELWKMFAEDNEIYDSIVKHRPINEWTERMGNHISSKGFEFPSLNRDLQAIAGMKVEHDCMMEVDVATDVSEIRYSIVDDEIKGSIPNPISLYHTAYPEEFRSSFGKPWMRIDQDGSTAFWANSYVWPPSIDTFYMVKNLRAFTPTIGIESMVNMGCGTGFIGSWLANNIKTIKKVYQVDVIPSALTLAAGSWGWNEIPSSVEVCFAIGATLFDEWLLNSRPEKIDLLISNPPYLPVSESGIEITKHHVAVTGLHLLEDIIAAGPEIANEVIVNFSEICRPEVDLMLEKYGRRLERIGEAHAVCLRIPWLNNERPELLESFLSDSRRKLIEKDVKGEQNVFHEIGCWRVLKYPPDIIHSWYPNPGSQELPKNEQEIAEAIRKGSIWEVRKDEQE